MPDSLAQQPRMAQLGDSRKILPRERNANDAFKARPKFRQALARRQGQFNRVKTAHSTGVETGGQIRLVQHQQVTYPGQILGLTPCAVAGRAVDNP